MISPTISPGVYNLSFALTIPARGDIFTVNTTSAKESNVVLEVDTRISTWEEKRVQIYENCVFQVLKSNIRTAPFEKDLWRLFHSFSKNMTKFLVNLILMISA